MTGTASLKPIVLPDYGVPRQIPKIAAKTMRESDDTLSYPYEVSPPLASKMSASATSTRLDRLERVCAPYDDLIRRCPSPSLVSPRGLLREV